MPEEEQAIPSPIQQMHSGSENPVPASQNTEGSSYSHRTVVFTMLAVFLVLLLASLDQDIVGTAMPRIVGELDGFDRYTWVTTAYLLTSTVMIPIYGKLSDLFGRKRILLICVLLFLTSSALCGASQAMDQLILFRAFQGLGAGGIPPVIIAVVADLLPPRERGKWMGGFGSVFGLSSILGPILGGWITDSASWRWVFYVNLPLGILALLVLIFLMPSLLHSDKKTRIDYLGALQLVAGTIPILLGLSWAGSQYPWRSWQILGLIGGGLVILAFFFVYEAELSRRGAQPIIDPGLFKNRIFSISLAITMITSIGLFSCVAFLPLYVQGILHFTATTSGLILTPMLLAVPLGSVISGQLVSRLGKYKWLAIAGMGITVIGSVLLLRLDVHSTYVDIIVAMIVLGLGLGTSMSLYGTIVQNALPKSIGQAASMLEFFEQMGSPAALATMGSILSATYAPAFQAALPAHIKQGVAGVDLSFFNKPDILLNPNAQPTMAAKFASIGPLGQTLLAQIIEAVKVGLTQSIHAVFLIGFVVLLLGLVVVFFLPEIELSSRHESSSREQDADASPWL